MGEGKKKIDSNDKDKSANPMRFPVELLFLYLFTAVRRKGRRVPLHHRGVKYRDRSCFSLNDNETGHQKIPHSSTGDLLLNSQCSSAIKHLCSHLRTAPRVSSPLLSVSGE